MQPTKLSQLLTILLAGIAMGLAAAPLNLWWIAWVALVPLWIAVQQHRVKWRWAVLLGWIWGMGYHGYSLSWLTGLHPLTWMGVPWLASIAIAVSCWLFVTCWGALISATWAGGMAVLERHWLKYQDPGMAIALRLLSGTTLWCALEWLWSRSFLWWTSLSLTQSTGNLVILHLGRLSGPATVVAAIVLVNGLLASAWVASQRHRKTGIRLLSLTLGTVLLLHVWGWSLYQQPLAESPQDALKIGIIQGNIPTREKLYPAGLAQAMQRYRDGYQQLVDQGVDAVLTPEAALPFFFYQSEAERRQTPLFQAIQAQQIPVWIGSFFLQGDRLTQSLVFLNSQAQPTGRYDKIKLVPLGEYIPFQETLGQFIERMSPVKTSMSPGQPGQELQTPWGNAIAGICFDSAFAELFREQAARGGAFIVTAANNDPYNARMMMQHHAQDVMRAIETDRWAARATNTGYSGIVDPHGQTLWRSQDQAYELHTATIYRRQTQTLYVRWGDWLTPLLVITTAIAYLLSRINQRPFSRGE